MNIISKLYDNKITAWNILAEIKVVDYEDLIKSVVSNNEFQRKRVKSSKSTYSLLKADLLDGCIIPPIVLALTTSDHGVDVQSLPDSVVVDRITENKNDLVILDGLQRTLNILELLDETRESGHEDLETFENSKLRLEFYIGINRFGILYRMLTLNTGQTPMSLRQQIEMLYLDYSDRDVAGVNIIRESEGVAARSAEDYIFKDLIEGFLAWLERSPLPIDRGRLLDDIASIDQLSKKNSKAKQDLFEQFVATLECFISKASALCDDQILGDLFVEEHGKPFGEDALRVFKRSQSISAFGAALGKLMDNESISGFDEVREIIDSVSIGDSYDALTFLSTINSSLIWLKENSTKIGNSQREYFVWFFRELLNSDSDSFKSMTLAASSALSRYKSVNF